MLEITDIARDNLKELFQSETAKTKNLVLYFQGFGWSGPNLGLALEESIEGLKKLESNSIQAYLDANLFEFLEQNGSVTIDYMNHATGGGYRITVGESDCDSGGCGGSC